VSIFTYRYVYIHGNKRSREFGFVRTVVNRGMDEISALGVEYAIDIPGAEDVGRRRNLRDTKRRLRQLLRTRNMGMSLGVQAIRKDNAQVVGRVRFRVLRDMPDVAAIPGTPQTKRWGGIVQTFFSQARFAGSVACKPRSDHAQGAALDHFDSAENMSKAWHTAIDNAEVLGVKYAILFDKIWTAGPPHTNSTRGFHDYDGVFHWHVHVSFRDGQCGVFCTPGYGGCG
jgi:hypothetical protein